MSKKNLCFAYGNNDDSNINDNDDDGDDDNLNFAHFQSFYNNYYHI